MMLSCYNQGQGYLFIIISSKEFLFLFIYSEYIFIRFTHVLLFLFLLYMGLSLPLFPLSGYAAAPAKSLQSCPTLCDPIDDSPPGSPVPGILQARTLEWVAISFSNAWKWKVKVESLSCVQPQRPHGLQPTRLLRPWDFPGKSTGVGYHCLLPKWV